MGDRCKEFQSCCSDYDEKCQANAEAGTCEDLGCGTYVKGRACQCNDRCKEFKSCCSDYDEKCQAPAEGEGGEQNAKEEEGEETKSAAGQNTAFEGAAKEHEEQGEE